MVLRADCLKIKEVSLIFHKIEGKHSLTYVYIYISARLSFTCILSSLHKSAVKATLIYKQDVGMIY